MTNHHNHHWRNKWLVDSSECVAKHANGLTVKFTLEEDGAWDSEVINIPNGMDADKLPSLLSQAGDIYKEHLDKRQ